MKLTYIGPQAYSRLGRMNPGDVFDVAPSNVLSPNWSVDPATLEALTVADLTDLAVQVGAVTGDKPTKRSLVDAIMNRVEIAPDPGPVLEPAGADDDVDNTEQE